MGYPSVSPYILFYIHGPAGPWSALFFELRKSHKITQTHCLQKLIRSLADIAVHICQIKRSAGIFFLKRASN